MFKAYMDGVLFYDDSSLQENLKVLSPNLEIEENSAGTFSFIIPPTNVCYNSVEKLTSKVIIKKFNEPNSYWEGRIIDIKEDFWKCYSCTCEGTLAYLNDTIQPLNSYANKTAGEFLTILLNNHNAKVSNDKKIKPGSVSISGNNISVDRYTNFETTFDLVKNLVETYGGHVSIRYSGNDKYLDWSDTYSSSTTQKIEFGKNLLDYSSNMSVDDFCTVLVPQGVKLEDQEGDFDRYLDVSSVNGGSIYVSLSASDYSTPPSTLPIDQFGRLELVKKWEDITIPENLLARAKKYLKDQQFDKMKLEVSAFDLRYSDSSYSRIELLDNVQVVSIPHGLNKSFPVTKMSIPLDSPENTAFTLGGEGVRDKSLTSISRENNYSVNQKIDEIPSETKITNKYKQDIANEIEKYTVGYVNIITTENGSQEFVISDTPDYLTATKIWRWTMNGLSFSKNGYAQGPYEVALTADGKINASLISTGVMNADLITAGVLQDQNGGDSFYLNMETGELRINLISELEKKIENIGTRNLIINTLNPEVSPNSKRPKILGQTIYTVQSQKAIMSTTSHGIKTTLTESGTRPYIRFGSSTISSESAGLNGLIPGETYTLSFDAVWNLYVPEESGSGRTFFVALIDNSANPDSFGISKSYSKPISVSEYGTDMGARIEFTFTIPQNTTKLYIYISGNISSGSAYKEGNFISISNLKLETGSVATGWTPAPEDVESYTTEYVNSAISISSEQIYTEVARTYETKEDANSKLSESKGYTDNRLTSYSTTSEMNTAINQTAESILQTAQATYTTKEEFNGLDIGSENLLPDSDAPTLTATYKPNGATSSTNRYFSGTMPPAGTYVEEWIAFPNDIPSPPIAVNNCAHYVFDSYSTTYANAIAWRNRYVPMTAGQTYTLSAWFYVKRGSVVKEFQYGINSPYGIGPTESIDAGESWVRKSWTFTADSSKIQVESEGIKPWSRIYIGLKNKTNSQGEAYVCGFQMEIGNKATAWAPSPDDLKFRVEKSETSIAQNADQIALRATKEEAEGYAGAAEQAAKRYADSQIQVSASGILSTVSSTYETKDNASSKYSQLNTAIEQNAEQISFKVSKSDYTGNNIASLINQTATTIKLSASKLDLEGALTISSFSQETQSALLVSTTTKNQYSLSTSSTTAPTSNWTDTIPEWSSGKYVWMRVATTKTYANNTSTTTYSNAVCDKNLTQSLSIANSAADSAEEANSKIDNLEVGGRNYIRNTQKMKTWVVGSAARIVNTIGEYNNAELTGSSSSWTARVDSFPTLDVSLLDGSDYVFSFEYRCNISSSVVIAINGASVEPGSNTGTRTKYTTRTKTFSETDASIWSKGSFSFSSLSISSLGTGSGDVNSLYVSLYSRTDGAILEVRKWKLEKGTKATDWSPAPEDTESVINSIVSNSALVNLCPSIYSRENLSGSVYNSNGIQWVVNNDGSVTATGTATGDSAYEITSSSTPPLPTDPDKTYTFKGTPSGGSSKTYRTWVKGYTKYDMSEGITKYDTGAGVNITGAYRIGIVIYIYSGYACPEDGLTFYPMLEIGDTAHAYISSHNGSYGSRSTTIKNTVSCYYRSTTNTKPTINASTSITTNADSDDQWSYVLPKPKTSVSGNSKSGRYFYTCERYTYSDGGIAFSTVRELSNMTVANLWCSANDSTYIDGGAIYANSVTADQIAANTITLGNISPGAKEAIQANTATKQEYAKSISAVNAPTSGWSETIPTLTIGEFVWTRVSTTVSYLGGTPSTTTSTPTVDVNLTNAQQQALAAAQTANNSVVTSTVKTQYYLSTSTSSATGGSWTETIPTWSASSNNKYVWTRVATTISKHSGTSTTTYSPSEAGTYDANLTKALIDSSNSANSEQILYYRTTSAASSKPSAGPTTWCTKETVSNNTWTRVRPAYDKNYPALYTVTQRKASDGTITCTNVLVDETLTVIDGANIITGSITANNIQANSISVNELTGNIINGNWKINLTDGTFSVGDISAANITSGTIAIARIGDGTITSGKLTTSLQTTINEASSNATDALNSITAFNLLNSIYSRERTSGSSWTSSGITFKVRGDGSILVTGTSTSESNIDYYLTGTGIYADVPRLRIDPTKKHTFHGCPEGGSSTTYGLRCGFYAKDATSASVTRAEYGSGYTQAEGYYGVAMYIRIYPGYACPPDGLIFYPMIEVGSVRHSYLSSRGGNPVKTIKTTVSCYYRSTTNETPEIFETTSIGTSVNTDNVWSYVLQKPKNGTYFYTCERYSFSDGSIGYSTVRALNSISQVSAWCSANNSTYIDGANIYAGSVTAAQIAAGTITSEKLDSEFVSSVNNANSSEQLIYKNAASGTTSMTAPTSWVTNTSGSNNTWTLKRPKYSSSYPVMFVATQRKAVDGTITCTTPIIDDTTTVIDGGNITTGTISAARIAAGSIKAVKLDLTDIFSQNITATNLNITGGSIAIRTNSETNDIIRLYNGNDFSHISPGVLGTRFGLSNGNILYVSAYKYGYISNIMDQNDQYLYQPFALGFSSDTNIKPLLALRNSQNGESIIMSYEGGIAFRDVNGYVNGMFDKEDVGTYAPKDTSNSEKLLFDSFSYIKCFKYGGFGFVQLYIKFTNGSVATSQAVGHVIAQVASKYRPRSESRIITNSLYRNATTVVIVSTSGYISITRYGSELYSDGDYIMVSFPITMSY